MRQYAYIALLRFGIIPSKINKLSREEKAFIIASFEIEKEESGE